MDLLKICLKAKTEAGYLHSGSFLLNCTIENDKHVKEVKQNGNIEIANRSNCSSCPYCGKTFNRKLILKEHIINENALQVFRVWGFGLGDR